MGPLLFITRNFPPLIGGMERLALESVRALADEWPLELLGPSGCEAWFEGECRGVGYGSAGRFLLEGWRAARRMAGRHGYQLVIGGSGLAAPLVRSAAKRNRSASVSFVHGLDLVAKHPVYRGLCLPALRAMDLVIANSRNTARLAEQAGIERERIQILNPGVDTCSAADPGLFLQHFPQAKGRAILLFVGRLLPRKGIAAFVRNSLPCIVDRFPDTLLVVVGGPARHALHQAGDEAARLSAAITDQGLDGHVLLTGQLPDEVLASLYETADLMVFPLLDMPGDVEGFGMVALEAAAHGLPTAAFAAGGVADAVAEGVSGNLLPAGDYGQMTERICRYLAGDAGGITAQGCRDHAAGFAWPVYGESLRELISTRIAADEVSTA